jgi:excisionase family DNA binding protein
MRIEVPRPDEGTTQARLLLKGPEAALALAVSPRTLWSLTKSGSIPCVRIGRAVRYSKADLEAWIESQKTKPAPSGTAPQLP